MESKLRHTDAGFAGYVIPRRKYFVLVQGFVMFLRLSLTSQGLLACLLAVAMGCGGKPKLNRPTPVPVNGLILLDGVPSEGTRVLFSPDGHQYAAAGISGPDGCFELQTFDAGDGAVPGKYKITAIKTEVIEHEGGGITETHFLPVRYRDPNQSGLTAEVTEEGPNEVVLDLTAPMGSVPPARITAD